MHLTLTDVPDTPEWVSVQSAAAGAPHPPPRATPMPSDARMKSSCSASSRLAAGTTRPTTASPAPASSPRATGSTPTARRPLQKRRRLATRRRNHRRARSLVHDHPSPPRTPNTPPRRHRQHAVRGGPRVPPQLPHAPQCCYNISTAIQAADAQTILNAASLRMLRDSYGVM